MFKWFKRGSEEQPLTRQVSDAKDSAEDHDEAASKQHKDDTFFSTDTLDHMSVEDRVETAISLIRDALEGRSASRVKTKAQAKLRKIYFMLGPVWQLVVMCHIIHAMFTIDRWVYNGELHLITNIQMPLHEQWLFYCNTNYDMDSGPDRWMNLADAVFVKNVNQASALVELVFLVMYWSDFILKCKCKSSESLLAGLRKVLEGSWARTILVYLIVLTINCVHTATSENCFIYVQAFLPVLFTHRSVRIRWQIHQAAGALYRSVFVLFLMVTGLMLGALALVLLVRVWEEKCGHFGKDNSTSQVYGAYLWPAKGWPDDTDTPTFSPLNFFSSNATATPAPTLALSDCMRLQENFYYFPDAFVSLFVLMTTENWPDVYYGFRFAMGPWMDLVFYFYLLIFSISFIAIFLGSIFNQFKNSKVRMKEKLKERKTLFQAFTLLNVEGTDVIDIQLYKYLMAKLKVPGGEDAWKELFNSLDTDHSGSISVLEFFQLSDLMKSSIKKKEKLNMIDKLGLQRFTREKLRQKPFFANLALVEEHYYFQTAQEILILLNIGLLITLACTEAKTFMWEKAYYFFLVLFFIFLAELLFRILSRGVDFFIGVDEKHKIANTLDFFIAVANAVVLFWPQSNKSDEKGMSGEGTPLVTVFAMLRISRLYKFVKWIGFHDDFVVLANIIRYVGKHLFEMLALLLFIMYFYAILGVMLFRCRYRVDPADQKVAGSFNTLYAASRLLFQSFTTSNWHDVMYTAMNDGRPGYEHDGWRKFRTISVMYFVSFLIMTVFILCNLLTSVIIESYDFWNDIKVKAQEQTKLRNAQEKERMAKQTQAAATSGDADKSQSSEPRKSTMSSGIKLKATRNRRLSQDWLQENEEQMQQEWQRQLEQMAKETDSDILRYMKVQDTPPAPAPAPLTRQRQASVSRTAVTMGQAEAQGRASSSPKKMVPITMSTSDDDSTEDVDLGRRRSQRRPTLAPLSEVVEDNGHDIDL